MNAYGSTARVYHTDDQVETFSAFTGVSGWLPEQAPLAMPRQTFHDADRQVTDRLDTRPDGLLTRRFIVFGSTFAVALLALIAPVILCAREGFQPLEIVALAIFSVLILAIACWFCSTFAGLVVMLTGREQDDMDFAPYPPLPTRRTALLMPLYNEDARAALARLGALDASLARLGASDAFDLFVLSDSTKDEAAVAELSACMALRAHAGSQLYYRRRTENVERKAGNIADWTRTFGGAYDFMIVLDADSTMAGETVLRLVDAMERNPGVGLIQTAPTIIKAQTLFARVSQFGVRLYGRVAAAGLAWWAGSEASYWGHNAILRTRAFADCAGLPELEGRKPFGGHIMSHDVVEAALLRRAGWAVHVTAALDGSCEETPPTLTDFIRRDHRWCQGNLQHLALIGARGLNPISRLQLAMGCMAYLSSPLWLASLMVGMAMQLQGPVDWTSFFYILNPQLSPFMLASLLGGVMLMGPKLMGFILVLTRPGERRAFGGTRQILKGMALEIALSAALAPILMVANTIAVIKIVSGHDAGWSAQQRSADGLAWKDAFVAMRWQMATGVMFAAGLFVRPDLATWFAPIVLPLLFAAPIAVFTSRRAVGEAFGRKGWMVTPDEDAVAVSPAVLFPATRSVAEVEPVRAFG
ncbi:glucans biosynthesis glucosyltransferase MdoH [Brevundimonas subvibrioides]|uniref:Glucans biosynthesis glucosyltransferase H n=1 Tax=Brevundimonas subvibrioides (strain ATCC 15264 / DSM 4735 / LMG 14903 / NBRC 16000 / CB 81) TaxID=633149 RepID=D9QK36_BRESC|nr:glucans biosynthesis glucosyltransferase MdoH [Brevundimonas subvibrioides]ADL01621.1 glycosyl transferase family 2 [Brevundimonas subvibrioides ATCC 15264]